MYSNLALPLDYRFTGVDHSSIILYMKQEGLKRLKTLNESDFQPKATSRFEFF